MVASNAHRYALPPGYRLGDYRIERYLGSGGFGITYTAIDDKLGRRIAIKEYLPNDLAIRDADHSVVVKFAECEDDFLWGRDRFLDEARSLVQFDHPNIVRVQRFFEAHGTRYIVMDYVDGEPLSDLLKRCGSFTEVEIREHVLPITDGLAHVHSAGVLHRDIKPGNIMIRRNGVPVLIDFGSAREAVSTKSRSMTAVLTEGYAPLEQYSTRAKQSPATDIYALGAVLYRCVTGVTPMAATERVLEDGDGLTAVAEAAKGAYSAGLLKAVDAALRIRADDRPRDVRRFLKIHDNHKDADVEDSSTCKTGKFGTLAETISLIESGTDINARDSDGRTPLGWAAEHGDPRCINALIEAGAQVNSYDGKMLVVHSSTISAEEKKAKAQSGVYDGAPHSTPLQRAASHKSPANVKALVNAGADIDAREKVEGGRTALHIAAMSGSPMTVKALLDAGADIAVRDGYENTVLNNSAKHGSPATLRILLRAGADIDAKDWFGATALHSAAKNGDNPENVRVLLYAGIRVDTRTTNGATPIHAAAKDGSPATIGALLKAGANIEDTDKYDFTPLHYAAKSRASANVRTVLDAGADIDARNTLGNTALHEAVERLSSTTLETITTLLDAGVDIDARNKFGETALGLAARLGSIPVVRVLLQAGADIDVHGKSGRPVLHDAAGSGNSEMIKVLLEAGAFVNAHDDSFQTALHRAAEEGHAGSVTALLEAGADVDTQNLWGATPLHSAAEELNFEAANVLLSAGADPDARDEKGRNPPKSAIVGDLEDFITILSLDESIRLRWRDQEKATMISTLAAASKNIDEADDSGRTALHLAAIAGMPDFMDQLTSSLISDTEPLDIGEIDAVCGDWVRTIYPVLIHAQKKGLPATISTLINAGASSNVQDNRGWMPLHYAAHFGIASNVRALIDAGAPVNGLTHDGETSLHLAARANWLYDHYLDLERVSDVLHALETGVKTCMGILIQAGCDLDATDENGRTALSMVEQGTYIDRLTKRVSYNVKA